MNSLKQAQAFHQHGNFNEAKKCYEKCLAEKPDDSDVLHGLGILHAQLSEYDAALNYLEKAVALSPEAANMHNHLGNLLKKLDRYDEAITAFNKALSLDPNFTEALNNLGNVYFIQQQFEHALAYYEKSLAIDPHYQDALYNIGLCHAKLEQTDEAISAFKRLLEQTPEHFGAHFHLGTLYLTQNRCSLVINHLQSALKINPYHFESHLNIGNAYIQKNKFNNALIHYQTALEINPKSADAHYNLAIIAQEKNNIDLAIQHYLKTISIDNDNFSAHNNLGVAFIKKQTPTFALKHFEHAQKLEPDHPSLNYIIDALRENKDLEGAPKEYVKELFDNYAKNFDKHILASLDYVVPEKCHMALSKSAKLPNNEWTVADLGCGTGLCGPFLKAHAKTLVGIDLSPNMLEKAREKGVYDDLIEADIDAYLANHPGRFNCLVAADVLVYYGDLSIVLRHAHLALAKKGLFVFSVEISEDEDFCIMKSGRYAHSLNYINAIASQTKFKPLLIEVHKTRLQFQKDVMGLIVVLQKR